MLTLNTFNYHMKIEYKVGDSILFKFKLNQVKEVEDGKPTSITNGDMVTYGNFIHLSCVPLTHANKLHSEYVANLNDKLTELCPQSLDNYNIHSELTRKWLLMCETNDQLTLAKIYAETRGYVDGILEAFNNQ
jgi:hypothetical protein